MNVIQTDQIDIAFITASDMPIPDQETHLIVDAVEGMGLRAGVIPWDSSTDWAQIPLVVIRTPWDYFKRLPEFLAWARRVDEITHLVNPYAVIEWSSHKRYLLELSQRGVPVVPTVLFEHGTVKKIENVLKNTGWVELVIKPAISISAIGALRVRTEDVASVNHLKSLLIEGDVLVQPFVPDVSVAGEVSMMYFGGEFSHAIRKRPKSGEYRVQHEYGGTVHPHVPSIEEYDVANAALSAIPGDTTYARVDLVSFNNKPVVMELELIEPELFFSSSAIGTQTFAKKLLSVIGT